MGRGLYRSGEKELMKDFFKSPLSSIIAFFLIGVVMACGIKAAEWVIPSPAKEVNLLVCVAEVDGVIGHCEPFTKFTAKTGG